MPWISIFYPQPPATTWTLMNPPNILTRLSSWTMESALQLDPCLLFGILIFITSIYKISVKKCCVPQCNRTRGDHVILHIFPNPFKNEERFNIWKSTISGHILSLENETIFCLRRICHLHFERQYNTWTNRLTYNAVSTWCQGSTFPIMTSMQSDTESNVSGFIRYSDKNFKHLYTSMIENMEIINRDLLQIEKNMKGIAKQAGPLENQLAAVLHTLPKPNITLPMDTE